MGRYWWFGVVLGLMVALVGAGLAEARAEERSFRLLFDSDLIMQNADGSPSLSRRFLQRSEDFLRAHDIPFQAQAVPWPRMIRLVGRADDILIHDLLRTPEREDQFFWLHPVVSLRYGLYTRSGNPYLGLPKDALAAQGARAACEVDSAQCVMLQQLGFRGAQLIRIPSAGAAVLVRLILNGRADFMITSDLRMRAALSPLPAAEQNFVVAHPVRTATVYLAAPREGLDPALEGLLRTKGLIKPQTGLQPAAEPAPSAERTG